MPLFFLVKPSFIIFFILFIFNSCKDTKASILESPPVVNQVEKVAKLSETQLMVAELAALVSQGKPMDYLHWNSKKATFLKKYLGKGSVQQQMSTWFKYCTELLASGNSEGCITEVSNFLELDKSTLKQRLTKQNTLIFELLALSYLRLGEQTNCQTNHTSSSCIIPLQEPGYHKATFGSTKAIEIYSLLQDTFPNEKYKWFINFAFMTLGNYPEMVPSRHKIIFPSANEQSDFPFFNEIAMNVGVAHNGLSGGTCIDDFNGDGFLDIFSTSYAMDDSVNLSLNDTKGGFINATYDSGLSGIVSGLNSIHADYDNDGHNDIFVLRGGWLGKKGGHPNSLLKNMGDGTFTDVTRSSKLLSYHPTQTASWGDFDNDGNLDLFIGNETSTGAGVHPCELFKNNGDGTFTNVASVHGFDSISGFIKGVTWGDINNDGWQDLYISVLGGENYLFKNNKGTFENISSSSGTQSPHYSFPCWFFDVNNDGFQDIFVSGYDLDHLRDVAKDYSSEIQNINTTTEKPRLYINNGDETFTESAKQYGISKSLYAMGANFGDIDNDGFLDFYVGTGAPDFSTIIPNRMFKNIQGKRFEEITSAGNFGHIQKGHGIAFADIDRDGDQDIYSVMGGAYQGDTFTNILYENPISKNNWIVIELLGTLMNTSAIGAVIEVKLNNNRVLFRTVSTGGSFGASSLQQEIGIGQETIKEIIIHWSNQEKQIFSNVDVNQKILITEGTDTLAYPRYSYVPFRTSTNQQHIH